MAQAMTRRGLLRSSAQAGVALMGSAVLASCASSARTPATTSASSAPTSGAAPTTTAPRTTAAPTAAPTNAATVAATATKGGASWLVRTNTVENDWEKNVAIPGFQKQHPEIAINLVSVPNAEFDTKLFSLFAAGTPADVWSHWGASGYADFVHKGVVGDMAPLVARDHYDIDAFDQPLVQIYQRDGKLLAIPITTGGMTLYFDRDLLQKASVDAPPVDWAKAWTWEQFVDAARKVTRDYGSPTGVYGVTYTQNIQQLGYLGGGDAFLPESYQTGLATTTQLDSPEVLAGVQAVYDLIYKDRVNPTPDLSKAIAAGNVDPFVAQRLAMNLSNFGPLQTYVQIKNFQWSLAADPILKSNRSVYFTDPWMLSSKSADLESAWSFVKYLTGEEGLGAYVTATGRRPARVKLIDQWLDQWTAPTGLTKDALRAFGDGLVGTGRESANHLLVGYPDISKAVSDALAGVWAGKTAPHDGLVQAKQQVDAVLATIH